MAQKYVTIYTDDLTGEESSEATTHSFSLNGVEYEIDLSPESYDRLAEALNVFIKGGRKVGRRKAQSRKSAAGDGNVTAEIRSWAKENGYSVNDRGRVPAEIREAYTKAH
ncbi:Lsr2 family protein [Streptomyces sp. NPDC059534]|uniref:histone-like nucleoid-structuring protein Lsr2 n=1 Tax=Streptomyces sp. NPDC059534 TaxID=3346859 RepID=UPI00369FDD2D